MELWNYFLGNRFKAINKWPHYFPIYERHLAHLRGLSFTMWEIGVQNGGSLEMWRSFFGPFVTLVGIDIDPECKDAEQEQINIRIGDQSDKKFLSSVLKEFGPPLFIIDDGSHISKHQLATFSYMYNALSDNGIYLVEDLHAAYWSELGGGYKHPGSFIEFSKERVDSLNAHHTRGAVKPTAFTESTFSVCFYDSVVVFEKRKRPPHMKSIFTGVPLRT